MGHTLDPHSCNLLRLAPGPVLWLSGSQPQPGLMNTSSSFASSSRVSKVSGRFPSRREGCGAQIANGLGAKEIRPHLRVRICWELRGAVGWNHPAFLIPASIWLRLLRTQHWSSILPDGKEWFGTSQWANPEPGVKARLCFLCSFLKSMWVCPFSAVILISHLDRDWTLQLEGRQCQID